MDDQRKALVAAVKTSRTPVPKYVPRVAASKATRKSSRKISRSRIARSSKARKGKARASRRNVASRARKYTRKRRRG